jgi:hypothetical protein
MGDIDIDIDIDGSDKVASALRRGLKKGLKDAGNTLLGEGEEKAEDEVVGARRVWTKEVKNSFQSEENQFSRFNHWKGKVFNPSRHADVVDRGLAPAGEITGSNPSVQDIMPWVVSNLSPADYGGGDGSPGFTPGDGGDGSRPGDITDENRTVSWVDMEELGLRADSFESDHVKAGTLGDGTNVVWKSHNDNSTQDWKNGIIRNEVVWSRAAEERGYDIGPVSRVTKEKTNFGNEIDGTMQEYVPGDQLKDVVYTGYGSPGDFEYTRDEFLAENQEWAAQTNVIDYLVGNGDRHMNNVRITPDGEPRNIDSGGNQFNEDLRGRDLSLFSDLLEYPRETEDQLYQENQELLDRTEDILDDIVNDEEYRNSLIQQVAEIHGEGSKEHDRMVKILGDEVGEGHILETDDRDIPAYKLHIESVRERHERIYNGGPHYDPENDIVVIGPDDPDSTQEEDELISDDEQEEIIDGIDAELNKLLGDDDNEE